MLPQLSLLVCEHCEEFHHGDCPIRGSLLTLDPSSDYYDAFLQYTTVFVPAELIVKHSKTPNAGQGDLKLHSLYLVDYPGNELYVCGMLNNMQENLGLQVVLKKVGYMFLII